MPPSEMRAHAVRGDVLDIVCISLQSEATSVVALPPRMVTDLDDGRWSGFAVHAEQASDDLVTCRRASDGQGKIEPTPTGADYSLDFGVRRLVTALGFW